MLEQENIKIVDKYVRKRHNFWKKKPVPEHYHFESHEYKKIGDPRLTPDIMPERKLPYNKPVRIRRRYIIGYIGPLPKLPQYSFEEYHKSIVSPPELRLEREEKELKRPPEPTIINNS